MAAARSRASVGTAPEVARPTRARHPAGALPGGPIVLRLVLAVEPALNLIAGGGDAEKEVLVEHARARVAATGCSRLVQLSAAGRGCAAARVPRRRSRPRRWPGAPALAVGARSVAPRGQRRRLHVAGRRHQLGHLGTDRLVLAPGAQSAFQTQTTRRARPQRSAATGRPPGARPPAHLWLPRGRPHARRRRRRPTCDVAHGGRAPAHLLGGPAGAVALRAGRRDRHGRHCPASPDGRARCASGAAHRRGRRERPRSGPARRGPRR